MLKQLQMGMRAFLLMASRVWTCICFLLKKQVRAVSWWTASVIIVFTYFTTCLPHIWTFRDSHTHYLSLFFLFKGWGVTIVINECLFQFLNFFFYCFLMTSIFWVNNLSFLLSATVKLVIYYF